MPVSFAFLAVLLLQPIHPDLVHDHVHDHGAGLEITGVGPAVLVARTASREGPFGHLVALNERLETVALAEVDQVTAWAVRPAAPGTPAVVALLERKRSAGRSVRFFDGQTLEALAPSVVLASVARGDGPLGSRGLLAFGARGGQLLHVAGDRLEAPGEEGAPTLWAHALGVPARAGDPIRRPSVPPIGFPSAESAASLVGARGDFLVFVGSAGVTCFDPRTGDGETFACPASNEPIERAFVRDVDLCVVVVRADRADALDPRLGEWATIERAAHVLAHSAVMVQPGSGRRVRFDAATGEIDVENGPSSVTLGESLKDLAWVRIGDEE